MVFHRRNTRGIYVPFKAGLTWQQTWSDTLDTDFVGGNGTSVRNIAAAASISLSGSSIRVTFTPATTSSTLIVDHASIVERSAGTADGVAVPTELLFSGGHGFTTGPGSPIVSDTLTFSIDETKDYLVIFDTNISSVGLRYHNGSGDGSYVKGASSSYNLQSVTGFLSLTNSYVVSKIEVFI